VPNRPHLQLISLTNGEEISNDALSIRGFQEYRCNDYHLGMELSLSACRTQHTMYTQARECNCKHLLYFQNNNDFSAG